MLNSESAFLNNCVWQKSPPELTFAGKIDNRIYGKSLNCTVVDFAMQVCSYSDAKKWIAHFIFFKYAHHFKTLSIFFIASAGSESIYKQVNCLAYIRLVCLYSLKLFCQFFENIRVKNKAGNPQIPSYLVYNIYYIYTIIMSQNPCIWYIIFIIFILLSFPRIPASCVKKS